MNMRPYKLKHIPTGLYYQPYKFRGSHFSKKGKIYQTKNNGLSSESNYMRVSCQSDSQIYKLTKDILAWEKARYNYNQLVCTVSVKDFIIEEI